jgi:hypothetical protein
MLLHSILVFHHNVIDADNHLLGSHVDEVLLVRHDGVEVVWVASHSSEGLQLIYPKLGATVELENRQSAFDCHKIANLRSGMELF